MPICISGCASICLDIHLFCRSACSLVWLSDNPSGNLVVRLHIRQSIWLDICLSAHPFASVCICICLRLHIWQSVLLLQHLSANLFCQPVLQDVHLLPAHLVVCLPFWMHICCCSNACTACCISACSAFCISVRLVARQSFWQHVWRSVCSSACSAGCSSCCSFCHSFCYLFCCPFCCLF